MAGKANLIAAGVAGVLALGTAGYFANEWRVCRGLEADFLDNVEGYTANVDAEALASGFGVEVDEEEQNEARDLSIRLQQMQLAHIYERCGSGAGRAAADLASDEVRDGMKDMLSLP